MRKNLSHCPLAKAAYGSSLPLSPSNLFSIQQYHYKNPHLEHSNRNHSASIGTTAILVFLFMSLSKEVGN
jgi:hypothetical protein